MVLVDHHLMYALGNEGVGGSMESLYLLRGPLGAACVPLRSVRQTVVICAELPGKGQLGLTLVPLKSMKSHVNQVAKCVEFLKSVARSWIPNNPATAQVERTEDDVSTVVLNEGQYLASRLEDRAVFDIVVDRGIL